MFVAPAYNTMPKTFADEILSRRFKRTVKKQAAPDSKKREHPAAPKRAVEEVVKEIPGASLQPCELRFEPEVSTSLRTASRVQPNYVAQAVPPRYEYDRERWNRTVELERKLIWEAEHQLEPKANRKAWRLSGYRWLYVAETSWAIFLLLVRWPLAKFLSMEPVLRFDLIILAAIGIVIACTPPEKPDTRPIADSQEFSLSARTQKPSNKNGNHIKEQRRYGPKKQETRQKNNPPAARDNQP
jgi:hypothetical protein